MIRLGTPALPGGRHELAFMGLAVGLAGALAAAYVVMGAQVGLGVPVGLAVVALVVVAFIASPHLAVSGVVAFFIVLPTLRIFWAPWIGAAKDLVVLAAILAVGIVALRRRLAREPQRADAPLVVAALILFAIYAINPAGGHGAAWFHGTRLVVGPLALMLVALHLDSPRRNLRWAVGALVASAGVAALYGLAQQVLGVEGLLRLGYVYGENIREANGLLRSFGILEEPFSYAAILLAALACVLLWMRRGPAMWMALAVIPAGLFVAYVRTAAVVALALVGLWLAQRGRAPLATALLASAAIIGVTVLATTTESDSRRDVRTESGSIVTLNGRTQIWGEVLGPPTAWPLGRGVGTVGTGAERATLGAQRAEGEEVVSQAVDSGYLAAVADVGLAGLLVLLVVFGRLAVLARRAIRRGLREGWLAAGVLAVLLLDATTRASFTAFPTAYVGFLMIGAALAAASAHQDGPRPDAGWVSRAAPRATPRSAGPR